MIIITIHDWNLESITRKKNLLNNIIEGENNTQKQRLEAEEEIFIYPEEGE